MKVGHIFQERKGFVLIDKRIFIEVLPFEKLLTPTQLQIIKLKFLDSNNKYTDVAKRLGITPVRVRQVVVKALSKFRNYYIPKRLNMELTKKQVLYLFNYNNKLYDEVFKK